jgi:hypothetical protein
MTGRREEDRVLREVAKLYSLALNRIAYGNETLDPRGIARGAIAEANGMLHPPRNRRAAVSRPSVPHDALAQRGAA